MSGKRQQLRNERALQDLVKTVPGNNTCADCFARNPGWASWSFGIFICMRCAGLHRKLGTHISKVKSLSMDSWTNDQVEFMKRTGNVASNRIYNPTNSKPHMPLDADEVESAMERYIRQKYVNKDLTGTRVQPRIQPPRRHDTGSTESDERHSPPLPALPPKTGGGRFGFASSMFPKSSKSKRRAEAEANMREAARSPSPPIVHNKPSRIFGTSVGESTSSAEDLESKMERLRDMGFHDDKRNLTVLKGLNGNLEKSIETLVRLGEGNKPALPSRPATRATSTRETAGISFDKSPPRPGTNSHLQSNNPFDMPMPLPQSSQSTGTLMQNQHLNGSNPYQQAIASNPFGPAISQSQYDINQSFQNLAVSNNAPQQTLFPHRTGGFPSQHPQHQKFLPSLETSHQAVPQQYPASATPYSSIYDFQPQQQSSGHVSGGQQQQTYNNPFLQQTQNGNGNGNYPSNPYLHHASTFPLAAQPQPPNPYSQQQQPHQLQQSQQQQAPQQTYDWTQPQPQQQQWGNQQAQTPNQNQNQYQQQSPQVQQQYAQQQQPPQAQQQYVQQQPQYQYQTQTQQLMSQQTGRANKSDILALYNYPQLAPQMPSQTTNEGQSQPPNSQGQGQGHSYQQSGQQQSTNTAANPGSNNPFMNANGNGSGAGGGHQSRESMMVESAGWMNGRHSPDAFASLSTVQTRSMR